MQTPIGDPITKKRGPAPAYTALEAKAAYEQYLIQGLPASTVALNLNNSRPDGAKLLHVSAIPRAARAHEKTLLKPTQENSK